MAVDKTSGKAEAAAEDFAADAQAQKEAGTLPGAPVDPADLSKGATEVPQRERNEAPSEVPYEPAGLPTD
jgi:hypothetical protein